MSQDRAVTEGMRNHAFSILGIAPTDDGRAIRAAFLRLARIYHPDRVVDMPEDVRAEAERRMKDASVAYELLRGAANIGAAKRRGSPIDKAEIREMARIYREAIEAKQSREKHDRARWQRWDEVERLARERADREAEIAAIIATELDPAHGANGSKEPSEPIAIGRTRDSLGERLDAARRGEKDPLVPRPAKKD